MRLEERVKYLILSGARQSGTFVDGYEKFWEQLDIRVDVVEIKKFCKYLDDEVGGASDYNIDNLYLAFKHPENKYLQLLKDHVKSQIEFVRSL